MKICMVLYDPQEFGGLEEYATTLAVGLKTQGEEISVLSMTWAPPENQYYRRLREHGVKIVQPPKWLSWPASNWATKEKIIRIMLWLANPFLWLTAVGLAVFRRCSWSQAYTSAHGRLRGILLYRFVGKDRREPLARLLLNWWRLRWQPNLFHIQGYTSTLLFAIEWAYAKNIPVIYEEHQTPDAQFDWWQGFQESINKATTVVAVSEESARALRLVCGVIRPIVVRNPLLPDPANHNWQNTGIKPESDKPMQVTTVARLVVAKGLTYLLDTIVEVHKTHPTVEFKVYGDGDLRSELLAKAKHLGLDGKSIFVGAFTTREELAKIMAQTDIFVMSSILEGQPLGVVEAMAYGKPIVTTAVGGIPELIDDGLNGFLCAPKNPICLARKIRILLEDQTLRKQMGQAARHSYTIGPYQPQAVCEHFVSIYEEALQQNKGNKADEKSVVRPLEWKS